MKCWDMKPILALPTCQEICSDKELEQIDFGKFDLGHPVIYKYLQLKNVNKNRQGNENCHKWHQINSMQKEILCMCDYNKLTCKYVGVSKCESL